MKPENKRSSYSLITVFSLIVIMAAAPAFAEHGTSAPPANKETRLVLPLMNPDNGARLFVDKGCVACHAVNGVGGHDAPNMGSYLQGESMSPFDFAANMWNHAAGMITAQEDAFGEQISLTGDEMADIIAFIYSDKSQQAFTEKSLTPKARKMMNHEHGKKSPAETLAKKTKHGHDSNTKPHND